MKYILMIVLIIVIMLVAQGVCKQYRERFAIFEAISEFFRQMSLNLGFQKQKIKEILNQASIKKVNKDIYTTYLEYLENGKELNLSFVKVLDDAEEEYITKMLISLGKNDTASEIKQLDAYQMYLKDKIAITKAEKEKYCPLITKLSFLFAIGLAILFI